MKTEGSASFGVRWALTPTHRAISFVSFPAWIVAEDSPLHLAWWTDHSFTPASASGLFEAGQSNVFAAGRTIW